MIRRLYGTDLCSAFVTSLLALCFLSSFTPSEAQAANVQSGLYIPYGMDTCRLQIVNANGRIAMRTVPNKWKRVVDGVTQYKECWENSSVLSLGRNGLYRGKLENPVDGMVEITIYPTGGNTFLVFLAAARELVTPEKILKSYSEGNLPLYQFWGRL